MTDEQLDRLGRYFVYNQVRERYGLTFEQFVEKVRRGTWCEWVAV